MPCAYFTYKQTNINELWKYFLNAIFFMETICTESSNLKHNKTDRWREYSVDSREWRAKDWIARWRGGNDGGANDAPAEYKQGFSI